MNSALGDPPPTRTGVLLLAFGGPRRPEEVRPFLADVLRGRNVPRDRLEAVAAHYEAIGGASPLVDRTLAQGRALAAALARRGTPLPVEVGFRHCAPRIGDAAAALAARGVARAVAVVLSPFRSEASWDRYRTAALAACGGGARVPELRWLPPWHAAPGFIAAVTERLQACRAGRGPRDLVVFTAHSIPSRMAADAPYARQFAEAAALVAARAGVPRYALAYQSRSGPPGEAWLGPDLEEVLARAAAQGVRRAVVVPVGFVCDHVEVLYDLDVAGRAAARRLGLAWYRVATVGEHPAFIEMLAELVLRHAQER